MKKLNFQKEEMRNNLIKLRKKKYSVSRNRRRKVKLQSRKLRHRKMEAMQRATSNPQEREKLVRVSFPPFRKTSYNLMTHQMRNI